MDVRVGLWRRLSAEVLMLLNRGVGEDLESPLDCKKIHLVYPKGNQCWIFIGRTDAEAPILWPPDSKSQLIGKDPDAGKDWGQEEKGATEDEMVGWHYRLNEPWVWASSGSWWWTGRPGVLRFMGLQRVGHDWATELNWNYLIRINNYSIVPGQMHLFSQICLQSSQIGVILKYFVFPWGWAHGVCGF